MLQPKPQLPAFMTTAPVPVAPRRTSPTPPPPSLLSEWPPRLLPEGIRSRRTGRAGSSSPRVGRLPTMAVARQPNKDVHMITRPRLSHKEGSINHTPVGSPHNLPRHILLHSRQCQPVTPAAPRSQRRSKKWTSLNFEQFQLQQSYFFRDAYPRICRKFSMNRAPKVSRNVLYLRTGQQAFCSDVGAASPANTPSSSVLITEDSLRRGCKQDVDPTCILCRGCMACSNQDNTFVLKKRKKKMLANPNNYCGTLPYYSRFLVCIS